ncbi:glycosyl hydrolase, partial [Kineococcus glutinatus]|uniref:glycosyl hydrolase n=1 Tax=Kineococcus glutinatus TaxID=1070872 RepID=UPI0031E68760
LNGDWYENHYVGDSEVERERWKEYFRRAVRALEVAGSDFEVDFNIAEGMQDSVGIAELYPGDDYVDVIGIDVYDSYLAPIDPGARTQARNAKENGLTDVVAFAKERDKPLSLPEWAMVAEGDTQGGGDNPTFVDQVADVVRDNAVRYQAYFNVPQGGVGMTLADAPEGAARYLERFGASGDAASRSR